MKKSIIIIILIIICRVAPVFGEINIDYDKYFTSREIFRIYFMGHSSLIIEINNKFIYIDPVSTLVDYANLPQADLILITHHHEDHYDLNAVNYLSKPNTEIYSTDSCIKIIKKGTILRNGDKALFSNILIEAVPAYNLAKEKKIFHPRGRDNGYILTIDDMRIYIAGDTENIPEMESLKNIDIAFLPMNQPYTMTPEQVADVVKKFKPKILYPYHTGDTDISKLIELMKDNQNTVLKIKNLK